MPVLRSRLLLLIMAAIVAAVVLLYSSSVKEPVSSVVINAESFNEILQRRIKEKQSEHSSDLSRYEEPMGELISSQAKSYGVDAVVINANWQKAEVGVLQGESEQIIDWLSDLDVLYGIRIQNLHLLSDSGQAFSIDRLVLVR